MKSLKEDLRNSEGFVMGVFVFRSMFETTSKREAPDNGISLIP